MTLIIDLDVREKEIEGMTFSFKPLNQSAMASFASISQRKMTQEEVEAQDGSKYITDPDFQNLFAKLIPEHCAIVSGGFQLRENGELRDGTIEDVMNIDNAAFFKLKMSLISELIQGSNLTLEESELLKK